MLEEDDMSNEVLEKLMELGDATLTTQEFLAAHLHELDYMKDNEIFERLYEHLAVLKESLSWHGFWRPLVSVPSSNWQIVIPLSQLVPKNSEAVWLLVWLPLISFWPVFEGKIDIVENVVNQCRLLEYYVISKDLTWVIAKNGQDKIFVDGEEVQSNLMKLKDLGRKLE